MEGLDALRFYHPAFHNKLKPIGTFIGLLFDNAKLGDEFRL